MSRFFNLSGAMRPVIEARAGAGQGICVFVAGGRLPGFAKDMRRVCERLVAMMRAGIVRGRPGRGATL